VDGDWYTILFNRKAALFLFYARSQLIIHYNCLLGGLTKEEAKVALVGAIIHLENGLYDKDLNKALNAEGIKIGTSKLKDLYTPKFEGLSNALGKLNSAFAVRKPAAKVVKAPVVALLNEAAFGTHIRMCRADACKDMVWKAFGKLTPTEDDYESRLLDSRSSKLGAPFKVRVEIVSCLHLHIGLTLTILGAQYVSMVQVKDSAQQLIVTSPPWGCLGTGRYMGADTDDVALTEAEIRDFGKLAYDYTKERPTLMLLHLPAELAFEYNKHLVGLWQMKTVPVTFTKPAGFVKQQYYTHMVGLTHPFKELVCSVDTWWIFEPLGENRPTPLWMYPGARQALGTLCDRIEDTKLIYTTLQWCRSDVQGCVGAESRWTSK